MGRGSEPVIDHVSQRARVSRPRHLSMVSAALLCVVVALFTVVALFLASSSTTAVIPALERQLQQAAVQNARLLAAQLGPAIATRDVGSIEASAMAATGGSDVVAVRVLDPSGAVLWRSGADDLAEGRWFSGPSATAQAEGEYLVAHEPVRIDGREVGRVAVVLDASEVSDAHAAFKGAVAGIVLSAVLATIVFILLFQSLLLPVFDKFIAESTRARTEATEAAETAREKGEFLANMSHEIRSPMNGVLATADLLRRSKLGQQQRRQVESIRRSAYNLLTILNDILDASKLEAGTLSVHASPFRVAALAEEVLALYRPTAEEKGVTLSMRVHGALPEVLLADGERLRQVLANLVGNATKFTQQGEIVLTVEADPDRAEFVRFAVHDSGEGIPAQDREAVFDPFSKVNGTSTRTSGGTGLGLYICRRLSELMEAELWFDSTPGKGSSFYFSIPWRDVDADAFVEDVLLPVEGLVAPEGQLLSDIVLDKLVGQAVGSSRPPTLAASRSSTTRVLVADDNPVNLSVMRDILDLLGVDAHYVENGEEVITSLNAASYELLFLDCEMPVMDGYATAREIRRREQNSNRHLAIVALTAHAVGEERERALSAGMDAYLSKPVKIEAIERVIDKYLALSSSVAAAESSETSIKDRAVLNPATRRTRAVVELALRLVPRQVEEVMEAVDQSSMLHVKETAHKLKGSLLSLGAVRATELARVINEAAERGDEGACADHINELAFEVDLALIALREELGMPRQRVKSDAAPTVTAETTPSDRAANS